MACITKFDWTVMVQMINWREEITLTVMRSKLGFWNGQDERRQSGPEQQEWRGRGEKSSRKENKVEETKFGDWLDVWDEGEEVMYSSIHPNITLHAKDTGSSLPHLCSSLSTYNWRGKWGWTSLEQGTQVSLQTPASASNKCHWKSQRLRVTKNSSSYEAGLYFSPGFYAFL